LSIRLESFSFEKKKKKKKPIKKMELRGKRREERGVGKEYKKQWEPYN